MVVTRRVQMPGGDWVALEGESERPTVNYEKEYHAILKACSDNGVSDTSDVPLSDVVRGALSQFIAEIQKLNEQLAAHPAPDATRQTPDWLKTLTRYYLHIMLSGRPRVKMLTDPESPERGEWVKVSDVEAALRASGAPSAPPEPMEPSWTFTEYTALGGKAVVVLTAEQARQIKAVLVGAPSAPPAPMHAPAAYAMADELEHQIASIEDVLDRALVSVRGAGEFREAVFALLEETPFKAPAGEDYEGLFGRLRNALKVGAPRRDDK